MNSPARLIALIIFSTSAFAADAPRGALMIKVDNSHQAAAGSYGEARWTQVEFNRVDYDTDHFADESKNLFRIPAGITRARLQCQLIYQHNTEGYRQAVIAKNSGLFPGFAAANGRAIGGTTTDINISTAIIPVKEGETFQCMAWQMQGESAPPLDLNGNGGVWFSIQAW